jgi:hypothetical protein
MKKWIFNSTKKGEEEGEERRGMGEMGWVRRRGDGLIRNGVDCVRDQFAALQFKLFFWGSWVYLND